MSLLDSLHVLLLLYLPPRPLVYTLPWHPYPGFLLSFLGSSKPVWTSLLRGTLVVVLTTAPIPGDAGWVS